MAFSISDLTAKVLLSPSAWRKRTFLTFRRAVAKFRKICHVHKRRKIIDIEIEILPLKEVFFAFEVRNVKKRIVNN